MRMSTGCCSAFVLTCAASCRVSIVSVERTLIPCPSRSFGAAAFAHAGTAAVATANARKIASRAIGGSLLRSVRHPQIGDLRRRSAVCRVAKVDVTHGRPLWYGGVGGEPVTRRRLVGALAAVAAIL